MVHKISSGKTETIKSELDLRGLLVEEALDKVDKYLDDAYLSSRQHCAVLRKLGHIYFLAYFHFRHFICDYFRSLIYLVAQCGKGAIEASLPCSQLSFRRIQ